MKRICFVDFGSVVDKDRWAALDLGGRELGCRARKNPESYQHLDREIAAEDIACDICWSEPSSRFNRRSQAAHIVDQGIEQGIVFEELLAEPVGNDTRGRAQPSPSPHFSQPDEYGGFSAHDKSSGKAVFSVS